MSERAPLMIPMEAGGWVEVSRYRSEGSDGALVIQIDTVDVVGMPDDPSLWLRVNVNDDLAWGRPYEDLERCHECGEVKGHDPSCSEDRTVEAGQWWIRDVEAPTLGDRIFVVGQSARGEWVIDNCRGSFSQVVVEYITGDFVRCPES